MKKTLLLAILAFSSASNSIGMQTNSIGMQAKLSLKCLLSDSIYPYDDRIKVLDQNLRQFSYKDAVEILESAINQASLEINVIPQNLEHIPYPAALAMAQHRESAIQYRAVLQGRLDRLSRIKRLERVYGIIAGVMCVGGVMLNWYNL